MARASDPNRALILQIIREERQAEQDRILAARLEGVTLDPIPDKQRNRAMFFDEFDDVDSQSKS